MSNSLLLILLAVTAMVMVGCVGLGALFFLGWRAAPMPAVQPIEVDPPDLGNVTYPREEFRKLVIGKTKDEVIAVVGKPERTGGGDDEHWIYDGRTIDTTTGKTDGIIIIWFQNGRVERVSF